MFLFHISLKDTIVVSIKALYFDFSKYGMCHFYNRKHNSIAMISKSDIISISHFVEEEEIYDYKGEKYE